MEPTPEEVALLTNMGLVATWAGLTGAVDDPASEILSFLTHVDLAPAEHPHYVAALTAAQWADVVHGWQFGGVAPNARQLGAVNL
eukprot:1998588-Amphidinium_carterae.1